MEYMLFSTDKYNFFSIPKSRDLGFADSGIRGWEKRPGSRDSGSRDYNPYLHVYLVTLYPSEMCCLLTSTVNWWQIMFSFIGVRLLHEVGKFACSTYGDNFRRLLKTHLFTLYWIMQRIIDVSGLYILTYLLTSNTTHWNNFGYEVNSA